ncbi:MAG: hypothetical protein HY878_02775 [Deltaproteobacteria bacterium]|nr:hypothetical protein [Deltaproteobacteria bacterium]
MAKEKRQNQKMDLSKRTFIKQTLIGGAAIASSAGLSKLIISTAVPLYPQWMYMNDLTAADMILMQRQYVVMSKEEKDQMIRMFIENYNNNDQT